MTRQVAAATTMTMSVVVVGATLRSLQLARPLVGRNLLAAHRSGRARIAATTHYSAHHAVGLLDLHCIRSLIADVRLPLLC